MDLLLLFVGFALVLAGVFGSFLPVLPGPTFGWLGVVLLYCTAAIEANFWVIGISLFVTISITVLDYIIPAKGAKKFGGSSYGIWGTNIGLVVGIVSPIPFGFIIGPFVGALVGELINNRKDGKRAVKAATGSFIGFLLGSFVKFVICLMFLGLFLVLAWQNRSSLLFDLL